MNTTESIITNAKFEEMWRDYMSCYPEVPLEWKEREVFKSFAKKIFFEAETLLEIEKRCDDAYEEGCADGKGEIVDKLRPLVENVVTTLEQF